MRPIAKRLPATSLRFFGFRIHSNDEKNNAKWENEMLAFGFPRDAIPLLDNVIADTVSHSALAMRRLSEFYRAQLTQMAFDAYGLCSARPQIIFTSHPVKDTDIGFNTHIAYMGKFDEGAEKEYLTAMLGTEENTDIVSLNLSKDKGYNCDVLAEIKAYQNEVLARTEGGFLRISTGTDGRQPGIGVNRVVNHGTHFFMVSSRFVFAPELIDVAKNPSLM